MCIRDRLCTATRSPSGHPPDSRRLFAVRMWRRALHQSTDVPATAVIAIMIAPTLIMKHFQGDSMFVDPAVTVNPRAIHHHVRSSHVDISVHTGTHTVIGSRILTGPLHIVGGNS